MINLITLEELRGVKRKLVDVTAALTSIHRQTMYCLSAAALVY
jgi:hypothetical protein